MLTVATDRWMHYEFVEVSTAKRNM